MKYLKPILFLSLMLGHRTRINKINIRKYLISIKLKISITLPHMISHTHLPKICFKKLNPSTKHKVKDLKLLHHSLILTTVMTLTSLVFAKCSNLIMDSSKNLQE